MIRKLVTGFCLMLSLGSAGTAFAFGEAGCGAGTCSDCHSLDAKEAGELLGDTVDRVVKVEFAEMPGVWLVEVERGGQTFPLYLDFSKSYVVAGNIYRIADIKKPTSKAEEARKVDVSKIPTDDALLLGNPMAEHRVIVFTDPLCPYCSRLHKELEQVVARDPNIAFLIKLNPLDMHGAAAYDLARAAVCGKSLEILEKGFELVPMNAQINQQKRLAGADPQQLSELQRQFDARVRELTGGACETPVVAATKALANELGLKSTPTLVLPDGSVKPGARSADELLQLLGSPAVVKQNKG